MIHNGEINTLRGNVNWMTAREKQFVSEAFGADLEKVVPILDTNGSDSSILDNAFEVFRSCWPEAGPCCDDAHSGTVVLG
ncbi:hypothetical protein DI43_06175 [Geobacillus sp. CAMR12739]|nr:hypothetical protein DI43_06175 [Geobacillus sp. CAMR12739]